MKIDISHIRRYTNRYSAHWKWTLVASPVSSNRYNPVHKRILVVSFTRDAPHSARNVSSVQRPNRYFLYLLVTIGEGNRTRLEPDIQVPIDPSVSALRLILSIVPDEPRINRRTKICNAEMSNTFRESRIWICFCLTRRSLSQRAHDHSELRHRDRSILILVKEHERFLEIWKKK